MVESLLIIKLAIQLKKMCTCLSVFILHNLIKSFTGERKEVKT